MSSNEVKETITSNEHNVDKRSTRFQNSYGSDV